MDVDIGKIIKKLIPLYVEFKNNKSEHGLEPLEIAWDIGNILKSSIEKYNIAPHSLYRKIYGLSEGNKNIIKNSYIPREFQGRCYRIRNIFSSKDNIRKEFPSLKSFTLFREAMPFFDNEKCLLKGKEKLELVSLLNSNQKNSDIMKHIRKLLKAYLHITNPRSQRLSDLDNEKEIFINFYNYIYKLSELSSDEINNNLKGEGIAHTDIRLVVKNTRSLCQDGILFVKMDKIIPSSNNLWKKYIGLLEYFAHESDAKKIRRFRRIIPVRRIINLANMLISFK
mgnify:CR=1 FL=1|jgi:hypothetical protein